MKIIVGLGNPGDKYKNNRHNIGWRIVEAVREKIENAEFDEFIDYKKHKAQIATGTINNENILIVKPQTFMNNSGQAVSSLVNFYKIDPKKDLLVIFDDKDMLFGKLRQRDEGSSGGHNGIKSIVADIGTQNFHRLKFGVGHEDQKIATDAFVLQDFSKEEENKLSELIKHFVEKALEWLK